MTVSKADRSKIAHEVAPQHSKNPMAAYAAYALGIHTIGGEFDNSIHTYDEFLSHLPKYRHPHPHETMIFQYPIIDMTATALVFPPDYTTYKYSADDQKTYILKSIEENERRKLDNIRLEEENESLQKTLNKARLAYKPIKDGEHNRTRNTRVVQELGFSTGRRPKRQTPEIEYTQFIINLRHKGLSRKEAIQKIFQEDPKNKTSYEATHNRIKKQLGIIKKRWKSDDSELYNQHIRKYFYRIMPKIND